MEIKTAKFYNGGVLLNNSVALPNGNTGHIRDLYNQWQALGNTPDPMDAPTLDDLKSLKRKALRVNCSDAILTPFQSSALGTHHLYDSRDVDQRNLNRQVIIGSGGNIYAHDGTEFTEIHHTNSQCISLIIDMDNHINNPRNNLKSKIALVNAAANSAAIDAITW